MSTGPARWIMHLDMDAFYAAVEQRDNPALRGLPVVVGAQPGGRGVVATCSYEARRFGIHSAMPIQEAHRRCPDAVYLRPRMAHYLEVARQIRAVMATCTPVVEPISIDEAFLDVSGLAHLIGPPATIGAQIKAAIRDAVGLTASVGIGPNRLVAKIASDFGKPDGLVVVPPEQVLDFLGGQPVGVLRGVGSRTLPILQRLGLRTVADLRRLSLTQLQAQVGPRIAASLYQQARGIASDRVGERAARRSLSKETTFGVDVADSGVLRDTLRGLAAEVATAARQEGIAGRTVTLKIRFCGFETHTRQRRLPRHSDDARTLFATAWSLYEAGKPVRLIGLGIADLGAPEPVQPDLFDGAAERPADNDRERRLTVAVDRIHARFGVGALVSAADPMDRARGLDETPECPQSHIRVS
ncbi:DNA polymerase IV [uncultured Lamprocystis sp.]|jgi:DNA polymerase-4|uniref:DNA polymerase IV n=1 Tax=uncultured Lamprocystis sp. TaxID=543132 RepID=UPI0025FEC012|nr:DNA polymerase IV [uncultured Lamprocystis sp.]